MSRYGGAPQGFQQGQQRSNVVFVGNLPFDYTEEQLVETFSSVGPVVSFRLVFDRDTGKPKGFGFCEYKDPETAASALRNLQGVDVGGRGLRLDFADTEDAPPPKRPGKGPLRYGPGARNDGGAGYGGGGSHHGGGGGGASGYGGGAGPPGGDYGSNGSYGGNAAAPKPLPPGVPLAPGQTASDNITNTLGTMPPGQLLDIMSQMKAMVIASPQEARSLLTTNPQLSYALFQGMLLMNLVDPAVLNRMLPTAPPAAAPYAAPPPQAGGYGAPPPLSNQNYGQPPPAAPQYGGYTAPPPQAAPQNVYGSAPGGGYSQNSYGAPPQQPPPQQQQPPIAPRIDPQQAALIQQVMAMTQEQIDALPLENRNTIMQIRAQAAAAQLGGLR